MVNVRLFITLVCISSLGVFASNILAPIEARYLQNLTVDPRLVGFAFAIASVAFGLLSYYFGRLSDRYGRRYFILLGIATGIFYPLWYAGIHTIFEAYGVKFAWAFSAIAMGPLLSAYIQDTIEGSNTKGKLFGYLYSAQSIAGSFGALAGGFFAETYGLSAPFYLLAAIFAVTFIITLVALPKDKPHEHEHISRRSIWQTLSLICSKPQLLFYLSLNTSWGINWGIKSFLWPLVIFDISGSDLVTGSIFATMGVVAFILLPFAGNIVDKYGAYRVSLFQFALLGVTGTGMALTGELSIFWILAGIYTIGEVLNLGQSVIITENIPRAMRGEVLGIDAVMDRTLNTIAPFFAGFLLLSLSPAMVFLLFVSLFWVSLIISWILYVTKVKPTLV